MRKTILLIPIIIEGESLEKLDNLSQVMQTRGVTQLVL